MKVINRYYITIKSAKKSIFILLLLAVFSFNPSFIFADNEATETSVKNGTIIKIEIPDNLTKQGILSVLEPVNDAEIALDPALITSLYRLNFYDDSGAILDKTALLEKLKCPVYLTDKIMKSSAEIKKLQKFLQQEEGLTTVKVNGSFNAATVAGVKKFQEKYTGEILAPWKLKKGTGLVKGLTLKKINTLYCQHVWPRDNYPELFFKYDPQEIIGGGKSKTFVYYDETTKRFLPLSSFDDAKRGEVTATADQALNLIIGVATVDNKFSGIASWYKYKGGNFAATRDWPKKTMLKVTNNGYGAFRGASVIIKVNDYGPTLATGRLIDLDSVAFKQIGILENGLIPVTIEAVE